MTWYELTRGIVMPSHCDTYGHMNVRHYAAFFDDAGWHMLSKAGVSLDALPPMKRTVDRDEVVEFLRSIAESAQK